MLNFRVHLPKWNNISKTLNFSETARFPFVFVVLRPLHWAAIMTAEKILGWSERPAVSLHGHALAEKARFLVIWEAMGNPAILGVYFTHMFVDYIQNIPGFFPWVFVGGSKLKSPTFLLFDLIVAFSNSNSCCFFQTDVS